MSTTVKMIRLVLALITVSCVSEVVHGGCSTVTTFNAGLLPKVNEYWTRRDVIADRLAELETDVLCMQEVWFEDDMDAIIKKLQPKYPYHYSALQSHEEQVGQEGGSLKSAQPACSSMEVMLLFSGIVECAIQSGCNKLLLKHRTKGVACLAKKCPHIFRSETIGADCISCAVLSSTSFDDFLHRCVHGEHTRRLNAPGLLLLSKKPLREAQYESYFPGRNMTLQRGFIHAQVEDVGTVVCTHMSHAIPIYLEYDMPLTSFAEQKQAEIGVIHKRFGSSNHILAGDLNAGRAVSGASQSDRELSAKSPESFEALRALGYRVDDYLKQDGRCTFCSSNPLVKTKNYAIDDVLVMGDAFSAKISKERVLDHHNPPLSDHYGVRATLCN